jgi:hypothetical protein
MNLCEIVKKGKRNLFIFQLIADLFDADFPVELVVMEDQKDPEVATMRPNLFVAKEQSAQFRPPNVAKLEDVVLNEN